MRMPARGQETNVRKRLARLLRRWAARLDPPSNLVGTAYVTITADTSAFEAALRDGRRTMNEVAAALTDRDEPGPDDPRRA
jgi:hypothetical protein